MDLKQAKNLARSRMGDKRYEHTINVKKMAVKLAKRYGEDPNRAALAALLHDAAKEMPTAEMLALLRRYPQWAEDAENRPTPVWHGVCAAILARTEWGVEDEGVLSAIACHTTGKPDMTRLDKILFLADMTSAERNWPGVDELRALELQDLDRAMLDGLARSVRFVEESGKPLDPLSAAAYTDIRKTCGEGEERRLFV
jgi:predicted HD superfamily hydrolase involved in NAD metabolism